MDILFPQIKHDKVTANPDRNPDTNLTSNSNPNPESDPDPNTIPVPDPSPSLNIPIFSM